MSHLRPGETPERTPLCLPTHRPHPRVRARLTIAALIASGGTIAGAATATAAPAATTARTTGTLSAIVAPRSAAAKRQWNLAGLGYLSYAGVDGVVGSATKAATERFQSDQCLAADGIAGPTTNAKLAAVMRSVQAKVGVAQDGQNGPNTRTAIANWQRRNGLAADGMAGPATFAKMGLPRTCSPPPTQRPQPIPNVYADSSNVSCYRGTRNLGVHDGYSQGTRIRVRLCAVPGFKSSSEESTPGSRYYIPSADGDAVVNSRVSGPFSALYQLARSQRVPMSASSTFRTMAHQKALCDANAACRQGDYSWVAQPGHSGHQLGVAVDYAGISGKGGRTCSSRVRVPANATWRFLEANARSFGIKQYSAEAWHWDAFPLANRC